MKWETMVELRGRPVRLYEGTRSDEAYHGILASVSAQGCVIDLLTLPVTRLSGVVRVDLLGPECLYQFSTVCSSQWLDARQVELEAVDAVVAAEPRLFPRASLHMPAWLQTLKPGEDMLNPIPLHRLMGHLSYTQSTSAQVELQ